MSEMVTDPATGEEVEVFVRIAGGFVDAICRASSEEAWLAAAQQAGVLVEAGDGSLQPAPGIAIDVLGPVMLTPPEYGDDLAVIVPATFDERHHVNMRLREDLAWQPIALAWMGGTPDAEVNRAEDARVFEGVALIDPDSVATQARVWL